MHNGSISRWDQSPQDRWPCWIKTWGVADHFVLFCWSILLEETVDWKWHTRLTDLQYITTQRKYNKVNFSVFYCYSFFVFRLLLVWHGFVQFFKHVLHRCPILVSRCFLWVFLTQKMTLWPCARQLPTQTVPSSDRHQDLWGFQVNPWSRMLTRLVLKQERLRFVQVSQTRVIMFTVDNSSWATWATGTCEICMHSISLQVQNFVHNCVGNQSCFPVLFRISEQNNPVWNVFECSLKRLQR